MEATLLIYFYVTGNVLIAIEPIFDYQISMVYMPYLNKYQKIFSNIPVIPPRSSDLAISTA